MALKENVSDKTFFLWPQFNEVSETNLFTLNIQTSGGYIQRELERYKLHREDILTYTIELLKGPV